MKKIYLTFILLLGFGFLSAQFNKNKQKGKKPVTFFAPSIGLTPPPPPDPVPIDGGASLLLLAGVGYGLKRMRKK